MKGFEVYYTFHTLEDSIQDQLYYGNLDMWIILYVSCNLATTILCTLLIMYRIITVSHRGMGIQYFRGIIEIIIESALIYSIALLVYIIIVVRNSFEVPYVDILAVFTRVCFIHLLFCILVLMFASL